MNGTDLFTNKIASYFNENINFYNFCNSKNIDNEEMYGDEIYFCFMSNKIIFSSVKNVSSVWGSFISVDLRDLEMEEQKIDTKNNPYEKYENKPYDDIKSNSCVNKDSRIESFYKNSKNNSLDLNINIYNNV